MKIDSLKIGLKPWSFPFYVLCWIVLFYPWVVFTASPQEGRTVVIEEGKTSYPLTLSMDLLEDPERQWTIEEISSPEFAKKFFPNQEIPVNFGHTSSAYWARLILQNSTNQRLDWFLEDTLVPRVMDHLTFYSPQADGSFSKITTGAIFPFKEREIKHRNYIFRLSMEPHQTQTFYLRFESSKKIQFDFILWEPETFRIKDRDEQAFLSLYFGIMLAMLLYNLFLFFSTRDLSYLYYVLFIGGFSLHSLSSIGLGFEYLWPNTPWWNGPHHGLAIACFFLFWAIKFNMSFLKTDIYTPRLHNLMLLAWGIYGGLIILAPWIDFFIKDQMIKITALLYIPIITLASVLCYRRGFRPAIFFLSAWAAFLFGGFIYLLAILPDGSPILPYNLTTKYSMQIGSVIEVILLSLGLGHRINLMKEEKEKAQAEALEAAKKEEETLRRTDELKDEFLANTSHELRTPLAGIIGLSQSLLDGVGRTSIQEQEQNLKLIMQSGKRLAHLINDIQDFSRLKNKDLQLFLQPVGLREVAELINTLCQPLLGNKALRLINRVPEDIPPVSADENRLQQILFNLVGNAIKFTQRGSIEITAEVEEKQVKVHVSDTGIGVSSNKLDQIFNAFEQADGSISRSQGGTGLGLYLTKQLVELHQGTMEVESTLGQGSRFTFSLPFHENPKQEKVNLQTTISPGDSGAALRIPMLPVDDAEIPLSTGEQETGTKKKILIVDDDPVNLQILLNIMSSQGYLVTTALNGKEALEVLELDGGPVEPTVELVLLDVMMPEMNGYEVCQEVRQKFEASELPIILLTARTQPEDLVIGLEAGANDYLTKPVLKEELLARIKNHLELKESVRRLKENERLQETILQKERAEEEALAAQRRLVRILDLAEEPLLSCNVEGAITFFNQSAEKRFGYTSLEMLYSPISRLFPKWALEFPDSARLYQLEAHPKENSPFPVKATLIPLPQPEGGFVISIAASQFLTPSPGIGLTFSPDVSTSSPVSHEMQYLQTVIAGAARTLNGENISLLREIRHLPQSFDSVSVLDQKKTVDQELRETLVAIMSLSLRYWSQTLQKSKIDLAEESQVWSVYIDSKGSPRTRTLDRYFTVPTLPKKPRWRDVLQTAYFVLQTCPDSAPQLKTELEFKTSHLEQLLQ